ncbi:MAG: hypothetical protein K6U87_16350, partial [Firmicutes bacterium]|nr:hypothetical protein [Bacillota bacterium]
MRATLKAGIAIWLSVAFLGWSGVGWADSAPTPLPLPMATSGTGEVPTGGVGGGGGAPAPAPTPSPTPSLSGPVTQSVGPSGGSLTATASNGTQIAVSVPAGAVNQATNVTVTPLTALPSTVSSISVIQAVDLAATPSARFAQPVTVTFTF